MKVLISTIDTKTHDVDLTVIKDIPLQKVLDRFEGWSNMAEYNTMSNYGREHYIVFKKYFKVSTVVYLDKIDS